MSNVFSFLIGQQHVFVLCILTGRQQLSYVFSFLIGQQQLTRTTNGHFSREDSQSPHYYSLNGTPEHVLPPGGAALKHPLHALGSSLDRPNHSHGNIAIMGPGRFTQSLWQVTEQNSPPPSSSLSAKTNFF